MHNPPRLRIISQPSPEPPRLISRYLPVVVPWMLAYPGGLPPGAGGC